jgi:hypothetical protein
MAKKKAEASGAATFTATDITDQFSKPAQPKVEVTHQKMIACVLNEVMKEVTYVQKTGRVKFGNTDYKYAGEGEILAAARPVLVRFGLTLLPSCVEMTTSGDKVYVKMEYSLIHTSGAVWPEKLFMWGCGADKGDKAIYKAITGANKYMLFKLLNIPTGDDPEAGTQPEEYNNTPSKPAVVDSKSIVLAKIMREFPGADDQSRANRMMALNQNLLAINGDPVNSPDQVTPEQWDSLRGSMK